MLLEQFIDIVTGFFSLIEAFLSGTSKVILVDMGDGIPDVTLLSLLFVGIFVTIVTMLISGIVGKDTYNSDGMKTERPKGKVNR